MLGNNDCLFFLLWIITVTTEQLYLMSVKQMPRESRKKNILKLRYLLYCWGYKFEISCGDNVYDVNTFYEQFHKNSKKGEMS